MSTTATDSARVEELRMERRERHREAEALNDRCAREKRSLYPDEQKKYDACEAEDGRLQDEIRSLERTLGHNPITLATVNRPTEFHQDTNSPTLGREQRMADWVAGRGGRGEFTAQEAEEFSLGAAIRGMCTSDWSGAEVERRALAEGTGAAGGFLTPELLSGGFIDRVRNATRVLEAGATTVPLESDQQSIPRLATGVTGAWRNENTAVVQQDATFERVTFAPKTLAVETLLSFELAEDMAPDSAAAIDHELSAALALELDRVALRGSGTAPEPRGIRNQTGVPITAFGGANGAAPTNYDVLVDLAATVKAANFEPDAAIYASRTGQSFSKLKDTTNQPLARAPMLTSISELTSNQVPIALTVGTSTDTSEIYVGQWDELLIGVRPQIGVRFVRESSADTLQWKITAYLRADTQLRHPAAFAVATGIRP